MIFRYFNPNNPPKLHVLLSRIWGLPRILYFLKNCLHWEYFFTFAYYFLSPNIFLYLNILSRIISFLPKAYSLGDLYSGTVSKLAYFVYILLCHKYIQWIYVKYNIKTNTQLAFFVFVWKMSIFCPHSLKFFFFLLYYV